VTRIPALRVEELFSEKFVNRNNINNNNNNKARIDVKRTQTNPLNRVAVVSQSSPNAPNTLTTSHKTHAARLFSPVTNKPKPKIKGPIAGASPMSFTYNNKLSMIRDEEKQTIDTVDHYRNADTLTREPSSKSDQNRDMSRVDSYSNTDRNGRAAYVNPNNPEYMLVELDESIQAKPFGQDGMMEESVNSMTFPLDEPADEKILTSTNQSARYNNANASEDSDSDDGMDFRRAMTEK